MFMRICVLERLVAVDARLWAVDVLEGLRECRLGFRELLLLLLLEGGLAIIVVVMGCIEEACARTLYRSGGTYGWARVEIASDSFSTRSMQIFGDTAGGKQKLGRLHVLSITHDNISDNVVIFINNSVELAEMA